VSPTTADVTGIAALADDVLRNLRITQCYHELSLAVHQVTGIGANWCTFATWASKQAGHTIRKEDLADALRARLGIRTGQEAGLVAVVRALRDTGVGRDARSVIGLVVDALDAEAALERAAKAVATGNRMVFEEIAPGFARFLEAIDETGAVRAGLRAGEPPDGQALLREAFERYRDALAEPDPRAKAECLYHANLLIGLHEQTRLQPQIAAALDAAFDSRAVRRRILEQLLPGTWLRVRYRIAAMFGRRPPLDDAIDALLEAVRVEMHLIITAATMSLELPEGRVIRLGQDIAGSYPASLATITSPPLVQLLSRLDPTPGSVAGSGARDWADLHDRLHLIAELFRCYHEWEPLFEPPFTAQQVTAIRAGQRPTGAL